MAFKAGAVTGMLVVGLGLIAVAEVMLMITGEIDLSVSGTFSIAP